MESLTASARETIGTLRKMGEQSRSLQALTKDCGGSIAAYRAQIDLLKREKELIPAGNIRQLATYNVEINRLTGQIAKLDQAGTGAGFKKMFQKATGIYTAAREFFGPAADFDAGMAQANLTAGLDEKGLAAISDRVKAVVRKNKGDLSAAPAGMNAILTQVRDVDVALDILDQSLRGSKAGFTDLGVVSGAVARTLAAVGKENASAANVMDTFFAVKRVGGGDFGEMATVLPGLVANASKLGVGYKYVAGMFAYMTSKGKSAQEASEMMENLFSAAGSADVSKKLADAGIDGFGGLMSRMQAGNAGALLGSLGLGGNGALALMASDANGLRDALRECSLASGETDRALALTQSSARTATEVWNQFRNIGIEVGTSLLPIISAGLEALGGVLTVVGPLVTGVADACGWWFEKLQESNPFIWGLTAAVGAAGLMLAAHRIKLMAVSAWSTITAVASNGLSTALKLANASLLATPWGLALVGVTALVAGISALMSKTDRMTKSYAAFNTELSRSKGEAKESFDAAIKASEGSEERAAAIRKINEQYGEYLPYLLSEKSTNEELRAALTGVNEQLEIKIRNKFREKEIEAAMQQADDTRKEVLGWMLDKVDAGRQKEMAADFNASWAKILAGNGNWKTEEAFFQEKYGIGTGLGNYLLGGFTVGASSDDWNVYSNLGGKMRNLQNAAASMQQGVERANLIYGAPEPKAAGADQGQALASAISPPLPVISQIPNPSSQTQAGISPASYPTQNGKTQHVQIGNIQITIEKPDGMGADQIREMVQNSILQALTIA